MAVNTSRRFVRSRLRRGEWLVGASALALVVVMFALPWYGPSGAAAGGEARSSNPVNGFDGLAVLRWLLLVTIATAFVLVYLQATRTASALPVSFSVFVTVLGGVTALCLIYRLLINAPGSPKAGAYLGVAGAVVLTYGGYRSMREEDRPDPARNAAIETVHFDEAR